MSLRSFSYELRLFGQICTPQEGTEIGRNALTLLSAVSHKEYTVIDFINMH